MAAKSHWRGYEIHFIDGQWVFADNGESVSVNHDKRSCGHCGLHSTPEGHDGCLGTLPGLMNACCGHGQETDAYIQLMDSHCIRGSDAINVMEILKRNVGEENQ